MFKNNSYEFIQKADEKEYRLYQYYDNQIFFGLTWNFIFIITIYSLSFTLPIKIIFFIISLTFFIVSNYYMIKQKKLIKQVNLK